MTIYRAFTLIPFLWYSMFVCTAYSSTVSSLTRARSKYLYRLPWHELTSFTRLRAFSFTPLLLHPLTRELGCSITTLPVHKLSRVLMCAVTIVLCYYDARTCSYTLTVLLWFLVYLCTNLTRSQVGM